MDRGSGELPLSFFVVGIVLHVENVSQPKGRIVNC
jgi:hypothetical protein